MKKNLEGSVVEDLKEILEKYKPEIDYDLGGSFFSNEKEYLLVNNFKRLIKIYENEKNTKEKRE